MSQASGEWKLKIVEDEPGTIEIVGNREGLRFLARVCADLSDLSDDQAKTAANHYHFTEYFENLEQGSVKELIILCKPDL